MGVLKTGCYLLLAGLGYGLVTIGQPIIAGLIMAGLLGAAGVMSISNER